MKRLIVPMIGLLMLLLVMVACASETSTLSRNGIVETVIETVIVEKEAEAAAC